MAINANTTNKINTIDHKAVERHPKTDLTPSHRKHRPYPTPLKNQPRIPKSTNKHNAPNIASMTIIISNVGGSIK